MADLVNIKGLSELDQFLSSVAPKVERNLMRGALRAGAKVVLQDARGRIHQVSGELANGMRIGTKAKGSKVFAYVRFKGRHAFIARFVEFGTRPHYLTGKAGKTANRLQKKGYLSIGGMIIGGSIKHPGARPKPFLRPALDAQASNATIAVGNYLKAKLESKHGLDTSYIKIEGDE